MNQTERICNLLAVALNTPLVRRGSEDDLNNVVWGIPTTLVGVPATGKTSLASIVANLSALPFFSTKMGNKVLEHGTGVPVPMPDGQIMLVCILYAARAAAMEERSIVLLDELNTGSQALQRVFQGIFDERQVGDIPIGTGTRLIGTMNPEEDGDQDTTELLTTIVTRNFFIDVDVSTKDDYAAEVRGEFKWPTMDLAGAELAVRTDWNNYRKAVNEVVLGFLDVTPTFEVEHNGQKHNLNTYFQKFYPVPGPRPNPRSWTWLRSALTVRRILGLDPGLDVHLAEGLVGKPVARLLAPWLEAAELKVEELVKNPSTYAPTTPGEARIRVAICAAYIRKHQDNSQHVNGAWGYIHHCVKVGFLDAILNSVQELLRERGGKDNSGRRHANLTKLIDTLIDEGHGAML